MKAVLVTACLACTLTTSPLYAQWLALPTPGLPRTADGKPNLTAPTPHTHEGHPDLGGLWNRSGGAIGDLENADKLQPWLQALLRERAENFYKDSPGYQCLPQGPAHHTGAGMKRIIQSASVVAILNEDLTYRQIFTDGRRLESDPNPTWMGYSVGRWEGDTLVVESAGFNDRTWLNNRGLSHTEALRVIERYRRLDFGHLEIDVTFIDSTAYVAPLHLTVKMALAADTEMLEAVCESPHGQQHWVGSASDAKNTAITVAPEMMAKYVGVYKGLWIRTPRTVRIALVDGTLCAYINEQRSSVPLIPQSETLFVGGGLGYQFVRDERGTATHIIEQHVSGSYTYPRQP